jgi:hypothetical protein
MRSWIRSNITKAMTKIAATRAALCSLLGAFQNNLNAQPTRPEQPGPARITIKWLGTAGWEIQFGDTTILIDPFPTRREAISEKQWMTDEEAMLKAIKRADYIFETAITVRLLRLNFLRHLRGSPPSQDRRVAHRFLSLMEFNVKDQKRFVSAPPNSVVPIVK